MTQLSPEVQALYPWSGHHLSLPSGHRIHYIDEGEGDPIVMVHGNPTWSFYYRELIKAFSKTHRCIAIDHLGCGLSDKPDGHAYEIREHIDNLEQLFVDLNLKNVTLVVHDWGGPIGFGAAIRQSDRIKRIVAFNTAVFQGPMPPSIALCRLPLIGPLLIKGLNGFIRVGFHKAIAHKNRLAGAVGQGYLAPYDSWSHRSAQMAFIADIPTKPTDKNWDLIMQIDRDSQVFKQTPMLIIWGEQDFCFSPWYREGMQMRFPDATVHAFEDCSHWIVEDAIERIVPLLKDFIPTTTHDD